MNAESTPSAAPRALVAADRLRHKAEARARAAEQAVRTRRDAHSPAVTAAGLPAVGDQDHAPAAVPAPARAAEPPAKAPEPSDPPSVPAVVRPVATSAPIPLDSPLPCVDRASSPALCRGSHCRGDRVGVDGLLCRGHYVRRWRNLQRAERRTTRSTAPPCDRCETTAGYVRAGCTRPVRYRHDEAGRTFSLCHDCHELGRHDAAEPDPAGAATVAMSGAPSMPTVAEIRRAALAIHSGLAEKGDAMEAKRYEAFEGGAVGPTAGEVARAAIREGLAREKARAAWTIVLPEPVFDVPAVAVAKKARGHGPTVCVSAKFKFLHPDTRPR